MNFLTGIMDFAKSVWSWFSGASVLANIAKTALTALAVSQLNKSVTPQNTSTAASETPAPDKGVRIQVDPDAEHKIPVVYGSAFLGGIITDAAMSNDKMRMTFCITLCEKTGVKLSDGQNSQFTFQDIYWDDQRLVFKSDGITVDYAVDRDGHADLSMRDLVKVYCYAGSSSSGKVPDNYSGSVPNANSVMLGWTGSQSMTNLVFAIVSVQYDSDKGVTGLGDLKFHITNSMTKTGDCIYDYMTNTRYGAGIKATEIYSA